MSDSGNGWRNRIVGHGEKSADQFQAHPQNWRQHPKAQREALSASLNGVGWVDTVIENVTTGHLIDGHERIWQALDKGDGTPVPYTQVELSEDEELLVLASFDPITQMAVTDADMLKGLLNDLRQTEIVLEDENLDKLLHEVAARADVPYGEFVAEDDPGPQLDRAEELRELWQTERGQVWEVPSVTVAGKAHRVMCGDSTSEGDVGRLMDGEKAFLMATDPPYGVDFEGQKYNPRAKDWDGIAGDKMQGDDLRAWLKNVLDVWLGFVDDKAAFYFWTAAMQEGAAAAAAILDAGLHIQSQIIWNKNTFALGQADYHWKHENCWYAFLKGKQHRWFGGRDKASVWEISKVANINYLHPMQKPLELYSIPMAHHTLPGEVCAEPFTGCGSQFVAAEQTGRICYGMEIEPKYVAVTLQRLADMGLEPELV